MRAVLAAKELAGRWTSWLDLGFAVVLCVAAALEVRVSVHGAPGVATVVAVTLTTLPLAVRSSAPVAAAALCAWGWTLAIILGFPAPDAAVPALAPLVGLYSLGSATAGRRLAIGCGLVLMAYAAIALSGQSDSLQALGMVAVGGPIAFAAGYAVRLLGFETDALEARAALLEVERDETAEAAVAEERARIARELHDVIGHSISVMGVQAGAVRRRLSAEQQRERDMLLKVERVGRDAVAEMRRLLGFLRPDDLDGAPAPVPSFARVADLVDDMQAAGLRVTLDVDGLDEIPPGRALAVFRVLQEGLTNVLKHAPGAAVTASVRRSASGLDIRIQNEGGVPTASTPGHRGHGLMGLRERVALYGGTLETTVLPGRGFVLTAHVPLPVSP